jgi:arylsulfatase A-like enzyme
MIDRPIAQLVFDLEQRGLLDRTLIVVASEFSRSVLVEGKSDRPVPDQVEQPNVINDLKYYGMHRHFTGAGSVLMFGGGIKRGFLHGETSDERPFTTVKDPVTITDLHATIYHALGISPRYSVDVEQRPFYVTPDGKGQPVHKLFA